MKRASSLILCVFAICLLGCDSLFVRTVPHELNESAKFGIVETRGDIAKSRLVFFDENLQQCDELYYPYATLDSSNFNKTCENNGVLTLAPNGFYWAKDEKKIISLKLKSLESTVYDVDQTAIGTVSENEDYIYSANNFNGVMSVVRTDKSSKETMQKDFKGEDQYFIYINDNKVFLFSESFLDNPKFTKLRVFDLNLNCIKEIDLSNIGAGQYSAVASNNKLYFVNQSGISENISQVIGCLNLDNYALSVINAGINSPFELVKYNGLIYCLFCFQSEFYGIGILDSSTNEIKKLDISKPIDSFVCSGDYLYGYHKYDHGSDLGAIYKIDPTTGKILAEGKMSPMDKDFSYIDGIFPVE